ncbi:uncharacterized protein N0V89_000238 [Didymosphaeria variabile]|uniref:Uncharacterized protein n=1 Tax=Didymosphaeria variabile TaxID=1932322 RepID=A0A9W8XWE1_9PLEO|nr:uncharacterized protein N0V89_000238 [Didymosphaeria variabile]KAJ4359682.1 hypothetical protein N0V89_000238 [Didymosphaeria variabile]
MQSLVYLFFFAILRLVQAITSPDIYSFTQPDVATPGLGDASLSPAVPSASRHGSGPASGINVFLPNYKSDPNWLPFVLSLKTVGLQVKVNEALNITSQTRTLVVYTSPSVTYSPTTADVTTLTNFVANGGNLVFMNQVPTALRSLAGVSASTIDNTHKRSILQLSNAADSKAAALQGFNFADYYDISMPIYENYTAQGLVNVGYTLANGSVALGNWIVRTNGVDSADTSATHTAFVRNQPSGAKGQVYSFGMDLGYLYVRALDESGGYSENYDGYYYPGYDIGTRIMKNIVLSSAHYVSLWTVPYNMGLAFTTTWDIDTYVSYPHGQGMAAAAMERGAYGNLNLHTKYVTDAYEAAYFQYGIPYIYQITGFRLASDGYPHIDFGSHSVSHSPNAVDFPSGTAAERYLQGTNSGYWPFIHECSSTTSDGTPNNGEECVQGGTSGLSFWTEDGTASGEVRVSGYLIRHVMNDLFGTNYNLTTYRPGNLAWNKYQANHCVANGYIGGSSCSGNSHLTHLPFQVTHNRESYQEIPYYEFPLQWSDGDGNMSSADFPGSDFRKQVNDIKNMARYGGHYNILLHPSDAVLDKIQIQRALHDAVRPFGVFFNQTGIANWWTIRDRAAVDITAASSTSVTMSVHLEGAVEGLTLQVPKTYTLQSASGSLSACQQVSYDTFTNAVVLRNTAKGEYTLTFSVGTGASTASTCPDFTTQPATECVAWDVAVDDFLETFFYNNGINLLLLKTVETGLGTNQVNGALQITSTTSVNSYYTEISRFCFDATVYTHLFFDTIIPKGTTFSVQLVSYDSGCNNERTSTTFLDIRDYAAADGNNHTVSIPLTDFAGENFNNVRGVRLVNIAPVQVPIYIDNIKIQKRCVTAPGEDKTPGLAIESFQNVDRWITGINNIFGKTDDDGTMKYAKLAELGKMQLLPANANSYIYSRTAVGGTNLNAKGYTDLSLNVRGPAGGSFDVVVTSGTGNSNSTVNTGTYATLSQNSYSNVTIPLSKFSGLDTTSISQITLRNFNPISGSSAGNFTVRWISLLGNGTNTTTPSTCNTPAGLVVLDFCDLNEFTKQTSALGTPFSDDNTMSSYNQTESGYINLAPRDSDSYFYSLLAPSSGSCATVNSTYNAVTLTVSGPQGATANVGFRHGGNSCNTNVVTDYVPVTFNTAVTEVSIPFSKFPSGFNQNYLQSFVMTGFSVAGATYQIHSLSFVGNSNSKGCALCEGTLVDTCSFTSVPRQNSLSGLVTDESTLSSYTVDTDGSLNLGSKADAYWYSQFGANACYDSTQNNATGLQLSVAAAAGTTFNVAMRWKTNTGCSTVSSPASVPITNYVTFAGNSSYQIAKIPFSDFPGINASRLDSIALSGFNPTTVNVKVGCISLVSTTAATVPQTCSCPTSAWLNYCSGSGAANKNANGGAQSDDGTMSSTPALVNGALQLKPAASGSYWYSLLSNVDVSSNTALTLNVSAKAGSSFNVQLQSSGQRSSLSSSAYGAMTGSPVLLSIPLSAFTATTSALNLKAITAVVLESFSDATATYALNCAYFGSNSTSKVRRDSAVTADNTTTVAGPLALWQPSFVWHHTGNIHKHQHDNETDNHAVLFTNSTKHAKFI